jgi:hypothetical protein
MNPTSRVIFTLLYPTIHPQLPIHPSHSEIHGRVASILKHTACVFGIGSTVTLLQVGGTRSRIHRYRKFYVVNDA